MKKGPYDIGLVEGSITTQHDAERIQQIRRQCKMLFTIGACATAGGIQAFRNWHDAKQWVGQVYAKPEFIRTLATSTPIVEHVPVDFELRGCPINKNQLLELLSAVAVGRKPNIPTLQRLHGMQAAWKRVHRRRTRSPLPGSGHTGWMRRHLSCLRPRLLWLLWPNGNIER